VRVPEYEVDGVLFFKNHFEGGYLFRDLVIFEATPPADGKSGWKLDYRFAGDPTKAGTLTAQADAQGRLVFHVPVEQPNAPGLKGRLRIETRFWNV
jgi:hypothetical protein